MRGSIANSTEHKIEMANHKKHVLIVAVLCLLSFSSGDDYSACFKRNIKSVPSGHLMSTKKKPLVIGHRGNPRNYQENTLDGFKSLLDTKADGFELDIYLTKDEQLVVYHDDNTKMLTGEDKTMWESTAEQLIKVELPMSLNYSGNVFNYTKRRPIPMLKDVLVAMKNSDQLMYLEMKPSRLRDLIESQKVGKAVAKMVTEMGLVNRAVINSFDPIKTLAAHQENPNIPTGFFYSTKYWKPQAYESLYNTTAEIPVLKNCIKNAPNGTAFINTMFHYGDIMKAVNASFLDMDFKIYDNPAYSNDTFKTLRDQYSPTISAGAWTLYNVKMSKEELGAQESVVDRLVKQGAERLITDDIDSVLHKLNRSPTSDASKNIPYMMSCILSIFLIIVY